VAHADGSRGDALLEGSDVLLYVLHPLLEVPDDAFLLVGVLQEFLDLYPDRLFAGFVLLDLGLGFRPALGQELGFLLLAVLLHRQAVDLLLVLDELLLHGVDHVHVLFQGFVDRVDLGLDRVPLLGPRGKILGAAVALGVELLQPQELESSSFWNISSRRDRYCSVLSAWIFRES
jgi:hypothetical protein